MNFHGPYTLWRTPSDCHSRSPAALREACLDLCNDADDLGKDCWVGGHWVEPLQVPFPEVQPTLLPCVVGGVHCRQCGGDNAERVVLDVQHRAGPGVHARWVCTLIETRGAVRLIAQSIVRASGGPPAATTVLIVATTSA